MPTPTEHSPVTPDNEQGDFRVDPVQPIPPGPWENPSSLDQWAYDNGVMIAKQQLKNLDLTQQLVETRKQNERDVLTGLYTRRYVDEKANHFLSHQNRRSNDSSQEDGLACVLFLDIDHFKSINDTLGHGAGDAVLRQVAQALQKGVERDDDAVLRQVAQALQMGVERDDDIVARYGGEEFVVFLPHTALLGAHKVAERLLLAVSASKSGVTISGGITECRPGESFDDARKRADAALYEAKGQGRNRIVVDGLPEAV